MPLYNPAVTTDPVPGAYSYLAASLEPLAIEPVQSGAFSYAVASNETKLALTTYWTRLGASGRWEIRHPGHPLMPLRGVTVTGLDTTSIGAFLDPADATYADARDTYFDRLESLYELGTHYLPLSSPSTAYLFLPGPYGSIITSVNVFDFTWVILLHAKTSSGFNLANENGDAAGDKVRYAFPTLIPVSKLMGSQVQSGVERTAGVGEGSLTWINCPSDWGAVTDSLAPYDFRDDFMGASLDTTTVWTRTQSSAGNVEIDTLYNWLKLTGSGAWNANGLFSQDSFAVTAGLTLIVDAVVPTTSTNLIVGFHDGSGVNETDFAHAVQFTSGPALNVKENANNRGAVGSGFTANVLYRFRFTLDGSGGCTYEVQGGSQYATLGGATWTDITPGTSASATDPVHVGATMHTNAVTAYIGDPRVYS